MMTHQTEHHLRRARTAARAASLGQRPPIAPVIENIGRIMKKIHRDRVADFTLSIPPDMMFRGERHDREERIGNLLDNGFKGARKTLHAEVKPHRKQAVRWCFCLDDDGPGLDKTQRQQVLQCGTCLDKTIPGSGLGLAIVCDLAHSYKGSFSLERSPLGGVRAILVLPLAA